MVKLFILLLPIVLLADIALQRNYYIDSHTLFAEDLKIPTDTPCSITTIASNKQMKRISTLHVQKALQNCGKELNITKHFSILVHVTPDIDTTTFQRKIADYYLQHYETMTIDKIIISSVQLTKPLPKTYTLHFSTKSYLRNQSTATIVADKNIGYINYTIAASLSLFTFTQDVKSSKVLIAAMLKKKIHPLRRFKSKPIEHYPLGEVRLKYHKKIGAILFENDLKQSYLIKKGDTVSILSSSNNLEITFQGRAIQSGYLGSIITVETARKKRLKARVIAPFVVKLP